MAVCVVVLSGCGKNKKKQLTLDPEYSFNLLIVGEEWPGKKPHKKLSESELEVFNELGRPDAVRIVYDQTRRIMTRIEVDTKFKGQNAKTIHDFEKSWIYYVLGEEVIFHPSGSIEHIPLTDKLRTAYRFGDPENRSSHIAKDQETWSYYSLGKRFKFDGDDLIAEESFPRMGRYMKM
jgi:hypothetical protein